MNWLSTDWSNIIIAIMVMIGSVIGAFYNYRREKAAGTKDNRAMLVASVLVSLAGIGSILSVVTTIDQRRQDAYNEAIDHQQTDSIAHQRDLEAQQAIRRLDLITDSLLAVKRDLTSALEATKENLSTSRTIRQAVTNVLHNTDTIYLVASLRIDLNDSVHALSDSLERLDYLRHTMANARFYEGQNTLFFFVSGHKVDGRCRVVEQELVDNQVHCKLEIPLVRERLRVPEPAYYEMSNKRIDINLNEGIDHDLPWQMVDLNLEFLQRTFVLDVPKRPFYARIQKGQST